VLRDSSIELRGARCQSCGADLLIGAVTSSLSDHAILDRAKLPPDSAPLIHLKSPSLYELGFFLAFYRLSSFCSFNHFLENPFPLWYS
jgi:hypothetical protein